MKTPGIFIAVLGVYCICALFIGMSSAADITMSTANHNSTFNAGPGHRLSPATIIANHEHKGVNASVVKPALRNGNNATVITWFESYRAAHPAVIGLGKGGFDLTNSTQQQQIITRLEKNGINVTDFKTDLLNGNIDAAKALLDVFMQTQRNNATAHMKNG
ncbi:MAG: hypothetical protein NTZ39_00105 [Methanoregula sp.]|nr:hypothetical protein [Methanoregula sp.]